jgi:lysozyme
MQTSPNGIQFIKTNEGFVSLVSNDNGKQAIGYGHDLLPGELVLYSHGISEPDAAALLIKDLSIRFEPAVNRLAPQANQNQFDALVDFCYNLGPGDLATMLHHGFDQVGANILAWCYEEKDGVEVKSEGLEARRAKELTLFNTPLVQ